MERKKTRSYPKGLFGLMDVGGKGVSGNEDGKCGSVVKNWDLCNSHFRYLVVMWKCR